MQTVEKIWMNGELVDWADARVHVGVHGLHENGPYVSDCRCTIGSLAKAASRHHLRTAIAHGYGRRVRSTWPQEAASVCPCGASP